MENHYAFLGYRRHTTEGTYGSTVLVPVLYGSTVLDLVHVLVHRTIAYTSTEYMYLGKVELNRE